MLKSTLSRKTWPAWVALGIGLLATVFASLQVKQGIEHDEVRQFAFASDQVTLKIQERLGAYAMILRGGAALFAASKAVERHEWRAYVEGLQANENVPGVQGVGFAQVIPPSQLAAHIARIRREGFPDYTVRPPGERAVYTSIVYLEPFRDRNLRAFGFDMYTEPVRRAAMEHARDTGEVALSGRVVLVQETGVEVQAGVLMYVPVYRNGAAADTVAQRRAALLGWAYSPYRMNDLMAGILGDWDSYAGKTVDLHIYAGPEATPATLLFDSKPTATPAVQSLFYQQRTIDINGQPWLLVFDRTSTAPVISYAPAWAAWAGGLALNGLLFGLMLAVINTRVNAARIAEKLTEESRRHEKALQESEAKIRLLMNSVAEAIYGIDMDGDCTFCNDACLRLLGYQHHEALLGKNMHWQIHGKYADGRCFPVEECRIFQAFNQGECMHVDDEVLWRFDGTSFPAEYWSYPQSQDGVVIGAVVTFLDITERKLAENALMESESRFRSMADTAPVMIWIAGLDTRCYWFNQVWLAFTGRGIEQEMGNGWAEGVHPEDLQRCLHTYLTAFDARQKFAMEYRLRRFDGEYRWLDDHGVPRFDGQGQFLGYIGSCADITEHKQDEAELLRSNRELEQFSYSISHDMRQPLRMISSYLQLLQTGLAGRLDAGQREHFNFAIDGARRLDAMLLGLLEYSRVGRKGEPPAWVESRALLDEALLFLRPAIAEAQAAVCIAGDWPQILASPDEMSRLLQNLIANAIKFRVAGRTPEIAVTGAIDGPLWRVSVADNGIGILPGQAGRLFQMFQRLQARAAYEGTGIGLALCRKIAEHHGGSIGVESAGEGQGSTVSFELPLHPAGTPAGDTEKKE